MKFNNNKAIDKASVYYRNNIIYKVNDEFLKLTGYTYDDIVGKYIEELPELLKANIKTSFKNDKPLYTSYIFTNKDEPKHVKITCETLSNENEVICFIEENTNGFLKGMLSTCIDVDNDKCERMSQAIYSYPDLVHLKANKNYVNKWNLFNSEVPTLIGNKFSYSEQILDVIKEKGYYYEEEAESISKCGDSTYWTTKANLIYEGNEAKYLKIIFMDDTEKVLTRKALRKQTMKMESILNHIPSSIVQLNNKGEYIYTNQINKEKLTPYNFDCESLSNKKVFKAFRYNDINGRELSFDETPDRRVLRGETLKDYVVIGIGHSGTSYYECTGTPIYDDDGNVESAVLIYKNIDNVIKAEEYYTLSKHLKGNYINYTTISYTDFKIKYINEGAFKSLKTTHPHINHLIDVIGDNFFDYYASNDEEKEDLMANIKSYIEEKSSKYVHTRKLIEEGKVEYIKTVFQPVFDTNNQVEKINCIGIYITDEELANRQMAKSLRAQDEVFVNTSHELKTPINLIFSASQLLDIYLKDECSEYKKEKIKRSNKIITQNYYRAIKLINNILDVSKIEQGFCELKFKNKNIVDVLDHMVMSVSSYIKDKKLSIIFDPMVEEKFMALDLYQFERIMLNLISNAIKFSNDDGVIFIDLIDKGTSVEVSVRDQGIGIDRKNLESIFNKFKQEDKSLNRNTEGTGIGLSLVKSIVELHDGTIGVESTLNVGTKFTVSLPSKVIEETVTVDDDYSPEDRVDMIKFELSDIYD